MPRDKSPSGQPSPLAQFSPKRNAPIPDLTLDTSACLEPTVTDVEVRGRPSQHSHVDGTEGRPHNQDLTSRSRSSLIDSDFPGKLDLTVIHSPASRNLDIIFAHGLGGGSRKTWCYDKNPGIFWPEWLPQLPTLSRARISTFGYNADIIGKKGTTGTDVESFAKHLLHCLTTYGPRLEKFGKVCPPQQGSVTIRNIFLGITRRNLYLYAIHIGTHHIHLPLNGRPGGKKGMSRAAFAHAISNTRSRVLLSLAKTF